MKDIYRFWQPGGKTGQVEVETPKAAAQEILGTKDVHWCRGESLSQPWVYVGNQTECWIWRERFDLYNEKKHES